MQANAGAEHSAALAHRQIARTRPNSPLRGRAHVALSDLDLGTALAVVLMLEGFATSFSGSAERLEDEIPADRPSVLIAGLKVGSVGIADLMERANLSQSCRLIVIAESPSTEEVVAAMQAGACDVLQLPVDAEKLISSVRRALASGARGAAPSLDLALLTDRERDVFRMVARGMLSKEIAQALTISERTVEGHRSRIRQKLGARNSTEMIDRILVLGGGR